MQGHFVTIHEFLVVPSLSHHVFSFHCFFTSSGKKPDNSDQKDKKEKMGVKELDSTVAKETGKHLMY